MVPNEELENLTVREFIMAYGPRLVRMARDANTMTALSFKRKYGLDVREARVKLKRLKELCDARESQEEARSLIRIFLCACKRVVN